MQTTAEQSRELADLLREIEALKAELHPVPPVALCKHHQRPLLQRPGGGSHLPGRCCYCGIPTINIEPVDTGLVVARILVGLIGGGVGLLLGSVIAALGFFLVRISGHILLVLWGYPGLCCESFSAIPPWAQLTFHIGTITGGVLGFLAGLVYGALCPKRQPDGTMTF